MRKTSVAIDEELLAQVQEILKTRTIRDTIQAAFVEVVRARARRAEIEALSTLDGLDLADEEVMQGAWRR